MDAALFKLINGSGHPDLDQLMGLISEAGRAETAVGVALVLVVIALRRFHLVALLSMILAAASAGGMVDVIKDTVQRPRPLGALGDDVRVVGEELRQRSFPSGHTACAFALCIAGGRWVRRRGAWAVGGLLAGLVGLSRIYVGAHYPGDVLAGALIGVFTGELSWRLGVHVEGMMQRRRALSSAAGPVLHSAPPPGTPPAG
ncbi:MAG: phosphatase PAP2 family protein [Myxococcota bacterium]